MSFRSIASAFYPPFLRLAFNWIESSPIGYRLVKGTLWSMAGAVISRGLMLCAMVLVARMLGKTVYGELGMIQSTVGMFGIFAGFGLGLTATKHVAEFRQKNPERAGRIIGLSWLVATVTGSLMALGLFIFAPWLAEHTINAPHLAVVLRIAALILFINALNGAQTGALSGFEAFKTIAYINLFVGLISFPILVGGAYFGGLTGAVFAQPFSPAQRILPIQGSFHLQEMRPRIIHSLEVQSAGGFGWFTGRAGQLDMQRTAGQSARWLWRNGHLQCGKSMVCHPVISSRGIG